MAHRQGAGNGRAAHPASTPMTPGARTASHVNQRRGNPAESPANARALRARDEPSLVIVDGLPASGNAAATAQLIHGARHR